MDTPPPASVRYALNLLLDRDQQLLLLLRSPASRLGAGQWGLPAGKIEGGETPHAAANRERLEEIGPGHQVELVRYLGPVRDTYYGGQFEIHLFHYHWFGGEIVLNHEHTEFAWVAKEAVADYDVMAGIEEDIALLDIWPQRYLNPERLPDYLKK